MITKVQKWGNSLAVRIPLSVAEDTQLKQGAAVNMASHDGRIVIAAVRQQKFKLNDLLKGITSRNKHPEVATGSAVGREIDGLRLAFDHHQIHLARAVGAAQLGVGELADQDLAPYCLQATPAARPDSPRRR